MIPPTPKVALLIPYYKQWEGRMGTCAVALAMHAAKYCGMLAIECSGGYIEDNRNGAIKFMLQYEKETQAASGDPNWTFDYVLWIDTDMIFPADALVRLIGHDKDIVGANYRQRKPPYTFVGHYLDGLDTHLLESGLHRMGHLPTGLLLVRAEIYRKMEFPWFDAALADTKPRDDVYFCRKAREMGYEIWCDHDLTFEVRHITEQEIPWFMPEQLRRIEHAGAEINMVKQDDIARETIKRAIHQQHEAAN